MSDGIESPTRATPDGDGTGVLANLPRTRPQRSSPRRDASRRAAARKAAAPKTPASSSDQPPAPRAQQSAAHSKGSGRAETKSDGRAAARPGARKRTASGSAGSGRARKTAKRPMRPAPELESVPTQGYETEDDAATGAVQPPGGAELLLSAVEVVGDLTRAGFSRSERLIKDALSRLPLS